MALPVSTDGSTTLAQSVPSRDVGSMPAPEFIENSMPSTPPPIASSGGDLTGRASSISVPKMPAKRGKKEKETGVTTQSQLATPPAPDQSTNNTNQINTPAKHSPQRSWTQFWRRKEPKVATPAEKTGSNNSENTVASPSGATVTKEVGTPSKESGVVQSAQSTIEKTADAMQKIAEQTAIRPTVDTPTPPTVPAASIPAPTTSRAQSNLTEETGTPKAPKSDTLSKRGADPLSPQIITQSETPVMSASAGADKTKASPMPVDSKPASVVAANPPVPPVAATAAPTTTASTGAAAAPTPAVAKPVEARATNDPAALAKAPPTSVASTASITKQPASPVVTNPASTVAASAVPTTAAASTKTTTTGSKISALTKQFSDQNTEQSGSTPAAPKPDQSNTKKWASQWEKRETPIESADKNNTVSTADKTKMVSVCCRILSVALAVIASLATIFLLGVGIGYLATGAFAVAIIPIAGLDAIGIATIYMILGLVAGVSTYTACRACRK